MKLRQTNLSKLSKDIPSVGGRVRIQTQAVWLQNCVLRYESVFLFVCLVFSVIVSLILVDWCGLV